MFIEGIGDFVPKVIQIFPHFIVERLIRFDRLPADSMQMAVL